MTDNKRRTGVSGSVGASSNNTGEAVTLSLKPTTENDPETIYNILFRDYDEVLSWIAENQSLFGIFATCGARDPMLPELSRQISEILI